MGKFEDMASCFLSFKDESGCGEFKGESKLVPLSQCNNDITAHLRRCHLTKENITESDRNLFCSGLGILIKLPNKLKNVCMPETPCEPREGLG